MTTVRVYQAPFLLDEQPKIIGGKMTLRQGAYVAVGGAISLVILKNLLARMAPLAILLAILILGTALVLAFYKVRGVDLYLDAYLLRILAYRSRTHGYTYSHGRR